MKSERWQKVELPFWPSLQLKFAQALVVFVEPGQAAIGEVHKTTALCPYLL